ncbi:Ogr/Delta-like zinc finger [Cupriavidus sp. YR651]|nr:Ogr/Delta-like zinc finger [Cupriavidus sp. YR651]
MRMDCPHCGSKSNIRSSRPVSRMTRELYCQCTNLDCGHTFVSLVEVVRTLSPSSIPDPDIARQLAGRSANAVPARDQVAIQPLSAQVRPGR